MGAYNSPFDSYSSSESFPEIVAPSFQLISAIESKTLTSKSKMVENIYINTAIVAY